MKKSSCILLCAAVLISGCLTRPRETTSQTSSAPQAPSTSAPKRVSNKQSEPVLPTPASPVPENVPAPPPPVLSPDLVGEERDRYVQEASQKIDATEQTASRVDQKQLSKEQHETWVAVQNFLSKAKEALAANDLTRAKTLAEKAQALVTDLPALPQR